jgi:hypothetical protein
VTTGFGGIPLHPPRVPPIPIPRALHTSNGAQGLGGLRQWSAPAEFSAPSEPHPRPRPRTFRPVSYTSAPRVSFRSSLYVLSDLTYTHAVPATARRPGRVFTGKRKARALPQAEEAARLRNDVQDTALFRQRQTQVGRGRRQWYELAHTVR